MTRVPRRDLVEHAAGALRHAYCPYSRFAVAAALLADDGRTFTACNMENASLGLTLCAERGAFQAAVSAGAVSFTAVAVVGSGPRPAYPCGACRQVMAEFCTPAFRVYLASARNLGTIRTVRLGTLLPHAFSLEHRRTSDP